MVLNNDSEIDSKNVQPRCNDSVGTELESDLDTSLIDVDALNDAGETPLFVAIRKAKEDNPSNVRILLEFGADVNRRTCDGSFPLYMASAVGHLSVVKELLKAGADPQSRCVSVFSSSLILLFIDWRCFFIYVDYPFLLSHFVVTKALRVKGLLEK
jgi:ankyrin repeat protein